MRSVHKVGFLLDPHILTTNCVKRLHVLDRVMTSHDACNSGTSWVLTIASLQRFKMEAVIPAPVGCEVRYMVKFYNAQGIPPIEIHRQLCQVHGHTRFDGQHISCKSSADRCLIIIHPKSPDLEPSDVHLLLPSRNSGSFSVSVFRMTERRKKVSQ